MVEHKLIRLMNAGHMWMYGKNGFFEAAPDELHPGMYKLRPALRGWYMPMPDPPPSKAVESRKTATNKRKRK